jgi:uncharacterized protein (DUF488 family)
VAGLVYTIGTSTRSIEEFISILKKFDLEAVVDVRRFPVSRLKHFGKDQLAVELERSGITYFYLGNLLGGFRDQGYGRHTQSSEFERGIRRLKEIASEHKTALACAERVPWKCHRKFIASRLKRDGWRVIHILDREQIWEPEDKQTDLKLDI